MRWKPPTSTSGVKRPRLQWCRSDHPHRPDEGDGGTFDQQDLATIVKYRTRVDARHDRRMAALADAPEPPV
ncbi:MAG: hypothetical protein R2711_17475 [Acidimicrobiales bacterium]